MIQGIARPIAFMAGSGVQTQAHGPIASVRTAVAPVQRGIVSDGSGNDIAGITGVVIDPSLAIERCGKESGTTVPFRAAIAAVSLLATCSACATARGPRQIDGARLSQVAATDWSRVSALAPAAPILLTKTGEPAVSRYFIFADASEILVLNLTDPALPAAATRALRELVAQRPEDYRRMRSSGSFESNGVRIGREGLIVGGRRIADLTQVVESVARDQVREVRGPVVARGSLAGRLLGAWLGFSAGAVPALGGAEAGVADVALASATILGGYLGHRWSNHAVPGLVYRAP
jgi:hypothetical protein